MSLVYEIHENLHRGIICSNSSQPREF